MTSTHLPTTPAASRHRPVAVLLTVGVLVFLGVTASAGGAAMISGTGAAPPGAWLTGVPLVTSWVVPGLVLGIGFGAGALFTGYGMLRRLRLPWLGGVQRWTGQHWSWAATLLLGAGHAVWISLELVYLPQPSILQAVYGAVALALLLLPLHPQVRHHLAMGNHDAPA